MSKQNKTFDAVEFMRSARDKISETIKDMTLDEELTWLAKQDLNDPFLELLRDRAVPKRRTKGHAVDP